MRNVVFIPVIEEPEKLPYKDFSLRTWSWWAEKHGALLYVMSRPLTSVSAMKPQWQRYHALRILEDENIDYDQVALVDADTMVRWDCPDFFQMTGHELSVTVDHDSLGWIHESLLGYRHLFPGTELSWQDYFNAGFIVLSKKHKRLLIDLLRFYLDNCRHLLTMEDELGVPGMDQTPLNYLVRQMGWKVNYLPKTFNLTQMNSKGILANGYFIDLGSIWHFNGLDPSARCRLMEECWERVQLNYRDARTEGDRPPEATG